MLFTRRTLLLGAAATAASWSSLAEAKGESLLGPPDELEVKGHAPAFVYPPRIRRKDRAVLVYLHGRGGNPERDARKWAKVARDYGWVVVPSGPEDRGGGNRGWANNWVSAKTTVDATMEAFHAKHGHMARKKGNILIGFSEGAFAAMNIGVREPDRFSRWLILAANDVYWGGEGLSELEKNRHELKRVYLLTGEQDGVVANTRRVYDAIEKQNVKVRIWTPDDIGHEVPGDHMRTYYRKPLRWLLGLKA